MNRFRNASCAAAFLGLVAASGVDAQDPSCGKNHYILTGAAASWIAVGNLIVPRAAHTATLLPDGRVLIAGGRSISHTDVVSVDSAELYDPATRLWTITGSLTQPRSGHTATLLPNGKVLVVGGQLGTESAATAELYDPSTGNWTRTGDLNTPRTAFTATLLASGKVLVAGGVDNSDEALASAELYDSSTGTWSLTGDLITARFWHTATPLEDGTILVAGGSVDDFYQWMTVEAELYDPIAGTWSRAARLYWFRALHTATRLQDGRVLVAGGYRFELMDPSSLAEAVLFDPASAAWATVANLNESREGHTATLLPDGEILVVGGFDWSIGRDAMGTELYEPATATWADAGSLSIGRIGHTATLLRDGSVLVAGGESGGFGTMTLGHADLYVGSLSDGCP
jgi:N-acetylneuraminic acid mutarotase